MKFLFATFSNFFHSTLAETLLKFKPPLELQQVREHAGAHPDRKLPRRAAELARPHEALEQPERGQKRARRDASGNRKPDELGRAESAGQQTDEAAG